MGQFSTGTQLHARAREVEKAMRQLAVDCVREMYRKQCELVTRGTIEPEDTVPILSMARIIKGDEGVPPLQVGALDQVFNAYLAEHPDATRADDEEGADA